MTSTAFAALVSAGLFSFAGPAWAQMPTGGVVTSGSATITQNTTTQTTINQTTTRGVVDWRTFSIGAGTRVGFSQPGATSVTLHRIVGPDPSIIAGQLNANRQIVLNNPSGVTFTNGATVAASGLVGLVGPGAARNGAISARVKRITVGGTETVAVDLAGDGLLGLQIRKPTPVAPRAANAGAINPPGGSVTISAAAARGVVDSIANVQGMAKATGASIEGGAVVFGGTR